MIKKLLLLATSFFPMRSQNARFDNADGIPEFIKKSIRTEISSMALKFLAGLVLSCVVIYATIQLGGALKVFSEQYEKGVVYEMLGFAAVAILGCIGLYWIFKGGTANEAPEIEKSRAKASGLMDLEGLALSFVDGLLEGFLSNKVQYQNTDGRLVENFQNERTAPSRSNR